MPAMSPCENICTLAPSTPAEVPAAMPSIT